MELTDLTDLKSKFNIVDYIGQYVELKFDGKNHVCCCPFKHENTPSFKISEDGQFFHCFSCGANGDIIDFCKMYFNISFTEAVSRLCEACDGELVEKPLIMAHIKKFAPRAATGRTERIYFLPDWEDGFIDEPIKEWIDEGISQDVLNKHHVHYDKDKTGIYMPIYEEKGENRIISLKVRKIGNVKNKYIYTNSICEKDFLYNYMNAEPYMEEKRECIVVEAEKSVMKLETWGVMNSVAVGSHQLSKQEQDVLIRGNFKNIVFAYDKDVNVEEIKKQAKMISHYKNVYVIIDTDNLIGEKDAPCDLGIETWNFLYQNRRKLRVN